MAETTTTEKPEKKPTPTAEQQRLEELFGPLNAGDSIKVRHIVADPTTRKNTRSICAILTELQGVTDLERHIYDYGVEQGWESGDYMAELTRPGHGGALKYGFFSFRFPPRAATGTGAALSPIELVKQAKELLGATAQPQASPDTVLQSVTAAMKVGADAAGSKGTTTDATAALLKPLIEGLVARLGKEPPAAPDPWAFLERLKNMGLIGQQPETDKAKPLVEQIGEIEQLVEVLGALRGPAGPAAEPTAVAVAKIFAPYVPQVLGTINNVVDVIRLRFGTMGPLLSTPGAPPAAPRAVGPPALPPAVQVLVTRTQAAITADDDGFFPAFAEGITTHILDGRNFLLAIQSGRLEEEQALVAVQGTGLLNPQEPRTRAWLIRFVHWLRAAQPMSATAPSPAAAASAAPPPANPILARCERCAQEYRFESREDFEQDTRICDNEMVGTELCKGNIVLVEPGEAAS